MSRAALPEQLVSAARFNLGAGKRKGLSRAACLQLAAEVLAVDSRLKPAFLYDYSGAAADQIRSYVLNMKELGVVVGDLHILDLSDNVLIVNLEETIQRLGKLLLGNQFCIVDVSSFRGRATFSNSDVTDQIKCHIADTLGHLKSQRSKEREGNISVSKIASPEWNLCTMFGLLLGYPASYWFDSERSSENCLSLTPLRVYTVTASCPRISNVKLRVYSFSVPETLCAGIQNRLELWIQNLQKGFNDQSNFTNLSISTETVSLAAVIL
ncbi:UPF0739 protein C1orf74 homolog [Latimeria chalumnae]|nr:PREDICTED: UPF0739 protein C1orf74 homolog [Latimeria chalumnae]|eukprot:XP_005987721.1 PREDICTED: UPF0739 protein C1orf74 homolog [Latimeria chalumnae]